MIDLDELHDKMISYRLVGFAKSDISTIDALELLGRLQLAEKDAARYRWLCTTKIYDQFDSIDQVFYANKGDTDKAIDDAMQCNK